MLFVVWLSILLSPTCSYCYKYSWNLYDDGNQYHHQKQQQQQPQHHYYQQQNQLPSDIMVDLINELGLKLLAVSINWIFYIISVIFLKIIKLLKP